MVINLKKKFFAFYFVIIQITIDCNTKNGTEYFFDTEQLTVTYYRTEKLPLSKFSMIVTPLKMKTSILS